MPLGRVAGVLAAIGGVLEIAGWLLARRFARRVPAPPAGTEPITILKPLHGGEPLLLEALSSLCEQDYPPGFQIVFGVHHDADRAIPVVRAIQERYPHRDIELVVDQTRHGTNPKIGNLINMLPMARHDILVLADSDVHTRPDYLRRLSESLSKPGVGLVTTLYSGLPAGPGVAMLLGATQITYDFLPGALIARAIGRRDCLGATMCLRRETLERIGGLEALKDHLADDNVLGQRVRAEGLDVALAHTIVATTVPESRFSTLWRHELRWARTIRTLEPVGFAMLPLQYPLFWAILALILSGGAPWAWALALAIWAVRALAVTGVHLALREMLGGLAFRCPVWLLPFRDVLSVAEWVVSHAGRDVDWRGQTLHADTPPRLTPRDSGPANFKKGSNAR